MADQRTYNARVTTEALEKKFRDTFPSQAGAELVDDLYASGVITPIVDFTAAAQGSELEPELQRAWDFSTEYFQVSNGTQTLTSTPGFYKVDLICTSNDIARAAVTTIGLITLFDGATNKTIWKWVTSGQAGAGNFAVNEGHFIAYLRAGDSLKANTPATSDAMAIWLRQIADVSGNLINPLGFVFS